MGMVVSRQASIIRFESGTASLRYFDVPCLAHVGGVDYPP